LLEPASTVSEPSTDVMGVGWATSCRLVPAARLRAYCPPAIVPTRTSVPSDEIDVSPFIATLPKVSVAPGMPVMDRVVGPTVKSPKRTVGDCPIAIEALFESCTLFGYDCVGSTESVLPLTAKMPTCCPLTWANVMLLSTFAMSEGCSR